MPIEQRDWIFLGIGLGVGFLVFSVLGQSLLKSAYKLTESEVKKLERKARERAKKEEKAIKDIEKKYA